MSVRQVEFLQRPYDNPAVRHDTPQRKGVAPNRVGLLRTYDAITRVGQIKLVRELDQAGVFALREPIEEHVNLSPVV